METRLAVMAIIVEAPEAVEPLNALLHSYASMVVGRMGIPYREKGVSVISLVVDAPANEISALSGKIGMIKNISAKVLYAKVKEQPNG